MAFVVPLVAVLYGLFALRSARSMRRMAAARGSWPDTAAPILLVVHGGLTINNLALRGYFPGRVRVGYGPRYGAVDTVATACLFLAALFWAHASVAGTRASEGAGATTLQSFKAGLKPIGWQLASSPPGARRRRPLHGTPRVTGVIPERSVARRARTQRSRTFRIAAEALSLWL